MAQEILLRSIRNAVPSGWRDRCNELRSLGDVSLATYLEQTGLDLDEIYGGGHSWTEMRVAAGLPAPPAGPDDAPLCGRWDG